MWSEAAVKKQPAGAVIKDLPVTRFHILYCSVTLQTIPVFSGVIILAAVVICVIKNIILQ